jgi:hypothetical protein
MLTTVTRRVGRRNRTQYYFCFYCCRHRRTTASSSCPPMTGRMMAATPLEEADQSAVHIIFGALLPVASHG